ncbi:MAG: shikimate dehydrogenase [Clostridia bacterium]|nr:shikimate dehydrogenase [Clostridia bacterium]
MEITGRTQVLAVVGNPVRHSLSPRIHNFLSEKLGLDYVYTAFEPDGMDEVLSAVKALGIRGINVTAPFKYKALELVDVVSDNARLAGSVNTVVNSGGILTGYSTDGEGLYMSMELAGFEIRNKRILVLGAGGAAKPVCVMLKNRGASLVAVKNRTVSRAEKLCSDLNGSMGTDIFKVYETAECFDIIINTTSVGMGSNETPLEDSSLLEGICGAVDLIYYPEKTTFLKDAEKHGARVLNGLGMLVFQGILAYEHFTGVKVPSKLYGEVLKKVNE